jgi:hypothetical protein
MSDYTMGLIHRYLGDPPPFRKGPRDTNDAFTNCVGHHYQVIDDLEFGVMERILHDLLEKMSSV